MVEDNENDAQMTLLALKRLGTHPTVATYPDGEVALSALLGPYPQHPRVILLDLKMPKVNGLEVLQALKRDPVACEIPVIIFTSSDEPRDVQRARELGCADYICKPIEWPAYREAIESIAHRFLPV